MALTEVKVPDIGDFKEVDVIEVLVKPGDAVREEQSLITVESDKATMEIPSPATGVVKGVTRGTPAAPAARGGLSLDLPDWPQVDFAKFGPIETRALSRIRKLAGGNLRRNWVGIPHVTQHDEADITELEAYRKEQAQVAEKQGFKLTPLAFLVKACANALKQFPDFNASLDRSGENLIVKKYFHIGVAVDTPEGLVVPVV